MRRRLNPKAGTTRPRPPMNDRCAICPGSFDPPTFGHLSLVERGVHLFDRVIVAVAHNSAKAALFSAKERVEMLRESLIGYDPGRVMVESFEGLLVDYARRQGAVAILRGLRATGDFEYEFQIAMVNQQLAPGLQSVFMMTDARWLHLSSTIVKEAASYGVDLSAMVPQPVAARLKEKFDCGAPARSV